MLLLCTAVQFETSERSAIHLIQFGNSERRAQIIWSSSGLQSAFRESIGSVRGFRARFASHLFSSGLQSAFRESIGSVRGIRVCFASQLVQVGASECVSRVN